MPVTVPVYGSDIARRATASKRRTGEFHVTTDQFRTFLQDRFVGPVNLGCVVNEAAMLALHSTHTRGCWPGDVALRLDNRRLYQCQSVNGLLAENWFKISKQSTTHGGRPGTSSDVTLSGGNLVATNTRTRHGGFFRPTIFGGTF